MERMQRHHLGQSLHLELDHLLLIVATLGQQLKREIVLSSSPFRSSFGLEGEGGVVTKLARQISRFPERDFGLGSLSYSKSNWADDSLQRVFRIPRCALDVRSVMHIS
jgi:hypothetical protein